MVVGLTDTEIVSSLRRQREPLKTEWKQIAASSDPKAIWAFAVRNSGTPESQLAQSRLVELIDAAVDVPTLQVLRLVAADAIAERARERLLHLEGWDFAKPNSIVSAAPASGSAAIKEVKPEEALAQASEDRTIKEAKRVDPALQAPERKTIQEAKREEPPLQPYEANIEAPGEEPAPARPAKISRNAAARLRATGPAPLAQAASKAKARRPVQDRDHAQAPYPPFSELDFRVRVAAVLSVSNRLNISRETAADDASPNTVSSPRPRPMERERAAIIKTKTYDCLERKNLSRKLRILLPT